MNCTECSDIENRELSFNCECKLGFYENGN